MGRVSPGAGPVLSYKSGEIGVGFHKLRRLFILNQMSYTRASVNGCGSVQDKEYERKFVVSLPKDRTMTLSLSITVGTL